MVWCLPVYKPSEKNIDELRKKKARRAAQIRSLREFVESFDGKFWKAFVERLEVKIKRLEGQRDQVEQLAEISDISLKMNLAQVATLKEVISLPFELQKSLQQMLQQSADMGKEISDKTQRLEGR